MVNNYEWLDYIPNGWRELARKMISECEAIYPEWEIVDLKEKWGAIRCYDDGVPSTLRDKMDAIIDKYEVQSARICSQCGAPATKTSTGWILPFCDKCGDKEKRFYKKFTDVCDN